MCALGPDVELGLSGAIISWQALCHRWRRPKLANSCLLGAAPFLVRPCLTIQNKPRHTILDSFLQVLPAQPAAKELPPLLRARLAKRGLLPANGVSTNGGVSSPACLHAQCPCFLPSCLQKGSQCCTTCTGTCEVCMNCSALLTGISVYRGVAAKPHVS